MREQDDDDLGDGLEDDGFEDDGSEEDGSEEDGSEEDGSEEDGSEDDGSEEERVAVEFELTEADVVQLSRERLGATVRTCQILGGVGALLTVVVVVSNWPVRPGLWVAFLMCSLMLALGARRFYLAEARRGYGTIHPDQRTMRVAIDAEALVFEGEGWSSALLWACLDGWTEWPSSMTLRLGSELRVLPKRVLSERDLHVLTELAQSHVQAPAPVADKPSSGAKLFAWVVAFVVLACLYQVFGS